MTRICWRRKWPSERCNSLISSPTHTRTESKKGSVNKATEKITWEECIVTPSTGITADGEMACLMHTLLINDKHLYTHPLPACHFLGIQNTANEPANTQGERRGTGCHCFIYSFINLQAINTTHLGNVFFSKLHNMAVLIQTSSQPCGHPCPPNPHLCSL